MIAVALDLVCRHAKLFRRLSTKHPRDGQSTWFKSVPDSCAGSGPVGSSTLNMVALSDRMVAKFPGKPRRPASGQLSSELFDLGGSATRQVHELHCP
jgi:hypothetical protein